MNKAIKQKWIAALRSGEYKQGKNRLRTNKNGKTSFCCLGVLCNLHAQAHPTIAATQTNSKVYLSNKDVLPLPVLNWAGLTRRQGARVMINGEYKYLTEHNDGGCTFAEIADAIEAQL